MLSIRNGVTREDLFVKNILDISESNQTKEPKLRVVWFTWSGIMRRLL
jgi:hypothetical protein